MHHTIALFTIELTFALSKMLMHSLWQGLILSVVTAIVVFLTRRSSAFLRYNLLVSLLAIFGLTVAYTFFSNLFSFDSPASTMLYSIFSGSDDATTYNQNIGQIYGFLQRNTGAIVVIWLFVVFIRAIKFISALGYLHQLRHQQLTNVDKEWEDLVKSIASKMGIHQLIRIAESRLVGAPVVIGHIRPLILVPIGLLTTISPAEIAAILTHEIAHIRRRDYLVNFFQTIIEMAFFFNPGVLWLSALIRKEREYCCDDITIAATQNKNTYIRALVACKEYGQTRSAFAISFSNGKGDLLSRVKRMALNQTHLFSIREWSFTAFAFMALFIIGAAATETTSLRKIASYIRPDAIHTPGKPKKPTVKTVTTTTSTITQTATDISAHDAVIASKAIDQKSKNPVKNRVDSVSAAKNIQADTVTKQAKIGKNPTLGEKIWEELVRDGILSADDKNASFKLGTKEMVVNGTLQPFMVYQKYKALYVPRIENGDWTLYNNYDTSKENDYKPISQL